MAQRSECRCQRASGVVAGDAYHSGRYGEHIEVAEAFASRGSASYGMRSSRGFGEALRYELPGLAVHKHAVREMGAKLANNRVRHHWGERAGCPTIGKDACNKAHQMCPDADNRGNRLQREMLRAGGCWPQGDGRSIRSGALVIEEGAELRLPLVHRRENVVRGRPCIGRQKFDMEACSLVTAGQIADEQVCILRSPRLGIAVCCGAQISRKDLIESHRAFRD